MRRVGWIAAGLLAAGCWGGTDTSDRAPGEGGVTAWQRPLQSSLPYLVADGDGVVVVAGFSGTVELDPPLTAQDEMDVLIAGFDAAGGQRFAVAHGGSEVGEPTAVARSAESGRIAVLGYGGDQGLRVSLHAPDGDEVWARTGAGEGLVIPTYNVSMSGDGQVVVGGVASSELALAGGTVPYAGSDSDPFFARVSPAGDLEAAASFTWQGDELGAAAVFDGLGGLYLAATPVGGVPVGGVTAEADDDGSLLVARIDEDGSEAAWARTSAGGWVGIPIVAAAPGGDLLVAGRFFGTFAMGDGDGDAVELESSGDSDVYIMRIGPDGGVRWLRRFGGVGAEWVSGLAVGPDGSAAVTGSFVGEAALDGGEAALRSAGDSDVFLLAFDGDGALAWARGFGGLEGDQGTSVAVLADGGVALAALFRGEVDFGGPEPLVSGSDGAAALVLFH